MAEIVLTKGYVAIVDDADFDWLSQWKWQAQPRGTGTRQVYARRAIVRGGVREIIYLHRLVAGVPKGVLADHRDGDTLNCRRNNLRPATAQQNSFNRRSRVGRSGFRGVVHPRPQYREYRYKAVIRIGGKTTSLGWSDTAEEAARLYDAAARQHFGEFAVLNFPEEGGPC